jgi:hypothetical protein
MKGIQKTDPDDARRARAEAGYFSVINYSVWSHQVIGEATVHRSDYPSADAVDEEIARTLKVWQRRAIEGSPK